MLVSLLSDVRALGPKGALVDVPDGYANTFLFPEHLAVIATKDAVAEDYALEHRPKETPEERHDRELAGEIDGIEVVIPVEVKQGKMITEVTPARIRQGLKELGMKVPFEAIRLAKSINDVGSFEVPVVFSSGFEAVITVITEAVS